MRRIAYFFAALSMVLGLAGAAPCHAQTNYHSYVSGNGTGTACTLAAPCVSFNTAISATVAGGEVSCVDGGANSTLYSVFIGKSITIDCAGAAYGQWRIVISGPGIVVTLRNLTVSTFGGTEDADGVDFQNGAALFVENCVIENFSAGSAIGIHFAPANGTAKLFVTDSVIKNNGTSSAGGGIFIQPASGAVADVTIERAKVENNVYGIYANSGGGGAIHGVVRDSVVSGNALWGIGGVNAGARLLVENTTVTANKFGLVAENGANMLVGHSSVVLNVKGLYEANGGTLSSYKNNNVNNNTTADGTFTTSIAQK